MNPIVIEKIPSLTCKKCGSFRVMMTDAGPECVECDAKPSKPDLEKELECLFYQMEPEELDDEDF